MPDASTWPPGWRPKQRRGLEARYADGVATVTDILGHEVSQLNDTAFAIWELCDGQIEVDEMVAAVAEATGLAEADARHDILAMLGTLLEAGLIKIVDERGAEVDHHSA